LGLLFGWVVWPVGWTPNQDDVASMGDAYDVNPTTAVPYAKVRLSGLSKEEQAKLFTDTIRNRTTAGKTLEARHVAALAQALNIPIGAAGVITPGPTTPSTSGTPSPNALAGLVPILVLLIVLVLVAAAAVVFVTRILPGMRPGTTTTMRRTVVTSTPAPAAAAAAATAAGVGPAPARPVATAPTTTPGGLGRFVASYALGNDNYDTSFSLETPRQEFLGECGMGISETIGEGKPDKVTAFDLWLFDKADVRTVTQIIMSDYAYNDQGLRAKLAAKGEAILAEKGKTVQLETQSLRIAAQIVELVYSNSPNFPPNSHFQKLTVEIVPSLREATAT
jgi:hypothetical protein